MSLRPSTTCPSICSGDMYCGVPSAAPSSVMPASPSMRRAMPKSESSARPCSVIEEDVLGLDVPVDDAVAVRIPQRARDVPQDALGVLGT